MLTVDDLRAHVGADLFEEASEYFWKTAARTGRSPNADQVPQTLWDAQHDLSELIWVRSTLSGVERVDLFFALYRKMPCYSLLFSADLDGDIDKLQGEPAEVFWRNAREILNDPDDRLADPISYWMWCGPFEVGGDVAERAWEWATQDQGNSDLRLRRVLEHAGPVAWELKAPLLRRYVWEPRWHDALVECIYGSFFDVYGSVDIAEASSLVARLQPTGGETGEIAGKMLAQIRKQLAGEAAKPPEKGQRRKGSRR